VIVFLKDFFKVLKIGPLYCTTSSYTGFATRDDVYDAIIIHAYTATTHDAIIVVSGC